MRISFEIKRGSQSKAARSSTSDKTGKQKPAASRRRKLISLAIYCGLLSALVVSAGNASNDLADKAYVNNEAGFSIRPPDKWRQQVGGDNNALVTFLDNDESVAGKIEVNSTATDQDLTAFVNSTKDELPKTFPQYKALNDFDVTVQGQPAHIIDAEVVVDNVWKRGRLMIEVKNGQAYVVSASTNLGYWSAFSRTTIDASLKSFKLTK